MKFRYGKWKGGPDPEFLKALLDLFNNLLLQANGDVDQALEALEQLGEQYGFFDDKFDLEAFKKLLKENDSIKEVAPASSARW